MFGRRRGDSENKQGGTLLAMASPKPQRDELDNEKEVDTSVEGGPTRNNEQSEDHPTVGNMAPPPPHTKQEGSPAVTPNKTLSTSPTEDAPKHREHRKHKKDRKHRKRKEGDKTGEDINKEPTVVKTIPEGDKENAEVVDETQPRENTASQNTVQKDDAKMNENQDGGSTDGVEGVAIKDSHTPEKDQSKMSFLDAEKPSQNFTRHSWTPGDQHRDLNDNRSPLVPAKKVDKEDEEKKEGKTWFDLVYEYTQNSTIHGIRYITDKDTYCFRKIIWVLVFLICCAYVSYQIQERITYFLSDPVMVKVEVNFNKSIRFPAVALCNQNSFRVTEALKQGYTDLIEDVYNNRNHTSLTYDELAKFDISKTSIGEMYRDLAHTKEDMVIMCDWNTVPCGIENFTMRTTDHGECLMFNTDPGMALVANKTGQDSGLHLIINIEQYEYMTGRHNSAGLRLMLFDRNDFPLVNELGNGVSPGTRSVVGVNVVVMERLNLPRGSCKSDAKLETFPFYTEKACKMECLSRYLNQKCGCRGPFMPPVDGAPVCSIRMYLTCGKREEETFARSADKLCEFCVPACRTVIYTPSFSYLAAAAHDINRILEITNRTQLLEHYINGRDASEAVDVQKFSDDVKILQLVLDRAAIVSDLLNKNLSDVAVGNLDRVEHLSEFVESIFSNVSEVYEFQTFVVRENFFRSAEEFDKQSLGKLTSDFSSYFGQFERNLNYLLSLPSDYGHRSVKDLLYNIMKNEIDTQKNVSLTALEELKRIRFSYENAEPTSDDLFRKKTKEEQKLIAPKLLLYYSVKGLEEETTLNDLEEELKTIQRLYSRFDAILDETYNKSTFSVIALRSTGKQHSIAVDRISQMRELIKNEIFHAPIDAIAEKFKSITEKHIEVDGQLKKMIEDLRFLNMTISRKDQVWGALQTTINISDSYINYGGWRETGKSMLCGQILAQDFQNDVNGLKVFIDVLSSRTRTLSDGYNATYRYFMAFTKALLDEKQTLDLDQDYVQTLHYFKNVNVSNSFLDLVLPVLDDDESFENFSIEFYKVVSDNHKSGDLGALFGTKFYDLVRSAERFKDRCQEYMDGNKLDERFYRDNFLQIDLYFSELSYELIQQLEAYTIFDLLSDVGGSLGLFIGASVISVFELLDLFLFNYVKKRKKRRDEDGRKKADRIYEGMI